VSPLRFGKQEAWPKPLRHGSKPPPPSLTEPELSGFAVRPLSARRRFDQARRVEKEPTPPEERFWTASFDLWRQRCGFVAAPLAFAAVWFAPLSVSTEAHRLAAILAAVGVLWVSEAIPMAITAFLGVAAAVALGVAPAAQAFAPFADPLIFLFIGTFLLARAIFVHGVDRRVALAILGWRFVGNRPGRLLAAYAGTATLVSMWISNTATVAMMFPIGLSILRVLEQAPHQRAAVTRFSAVFLLSCAFGASIGGLATPVGTPPNLIGLGFLRQSAQAEVPFFHWMALGIPLVALLWGWCVWQLGRNFGELEAVLTAVSEHIAEERARLGPWTAGQRNTLVAFACTVLLWVSPGVVALVLGEQHPAYRWLVTTFPEGVAALFGAGLLFVLPIDWRRQRFTLRWEDAVQIDWWIVFLYGGGLALGTLAFRTGLAEALGHALTTRLGIQTMPGLVLVSTACATLLSETTSNTASANMIVPVVIAFAHSAGLDPVLPAVGATFGASLGFMLPVSTPTNAIVYSSGRIPLVTMMRHGLLLDIFGVVAVAAVLLLLGPLILAG